MNNNLDRLREKFTKNELVIGTVVSTNCPTISEVLCRCGYDFIFIDGEHGTLDNTDIDMHIMATNGSGCAPIVRVRWNDPVIVKPILDMGPAGIIFPWIRTAEDAKLAVSSCKYPPRGIRGYGPRRANNYSFMDNNEYFKISEKEPLVILQIEHIDCVNNLEEIVNVEGVDSVMVGPNDLSGSIGLLGQTRHPDVIKLYDKIAKICKKSNTLLGCAAGAGNTDNLKEWIERGINWILMDWDLGHLAFGGKNSFDTIMKIYNQVKQK